MDGERKERFGRMILFRKKVKIACECNFDDFTYQAKALHLKRVSLLSNRHFVEY